MTEKSGSAPSPPSPPSSGAQSEQMSSPAEPTVRLNWTKLALAIVLTCASITIVIPPNPPSHSPSSTAGDADLKDAYVTDHTVARAAFAGTAGLLMLLVTYVLPLHLSTASGTRTGTGWASRLARGRSLALGFYHPRLVTPLYLQLDDPTEHAAALTCLAGVFLRQWAFRTLADKFTYAVTVFADHELITTGPYAWLMHPGYTGLVMAMAGLFWYMGFRGWRYVGLVGMYLGPVLVRMRDEERVMAEAFGEEMWREYVRGRQRLVPYVW